MQIVKTFIDGLFVVEPTILEDQRGYFFESFNEASFNTATGIKVRFIQDNESKSKRGVLRGLHFQRAPYAQAKLVSVVRGRVLDVAVDIRKDSSTFGKYVMTELSGDNHRQMFIPKGFAHGYVVLEDDTIFQYKCDEYYHPEAEGSVAWNDPQIGIDWGVNECDIILSDKDKLSPLLSNLTIE